MKKADAKNVYAVFFLVIVTCLLSSFAGTSSANSENDQWQIVRMRVTAYCPCPQCCGSYSDGITASGHKISDGDRFVAADKSYPFGNEMIIEGYKNSGIVKVLDRGGVIKGDRLDVFFNTHQEALEWGVRYIDVKIRRN